MSNIKERLYELDGLRGVAALAVILYHYTTRFSVKFDNTIISDVINFRFGHYGVQAFFVISGFVIYMSITRVKSPIEFAYRRFVRLYPTFWLCLIITAVFVALLGPDLLKVSFRDFLVNLTMLPSLFSAKYVDGAYWTLEIEMFFYGFIFLMLFFRITNKMKLISWVYLFLGIMFYTQYKLFSFFLYGTLFLAGINFYNMWRNGPDFYNYLQLIIIILVAFFGRGYLLGLITIFIFLTMNLLILNRLKFLASPVLLFLEKFLMLYIYYIKI